MLYISAFLIVRPLFGKKYLYTYDLVSILFRDHESQFLLLFLCLFLF